MLFYFFDGKDKFFIESIAKNVDTFYNKKGKYFVYIVLRDNLDGALCFAQIEQENGRICRKVELVNG